MIPQPKPDVPVYAHEDLLAYATRLGMNAGLPEERARIQAEMLLESDLMGHTTHGLNLLPVFLAELGSGGMKAEGEPVVLADHPAALHWDGQFLPGTWLMARAIEAARAKLKNNPVVTVVIRQAHHIAGLVAYLRLATEACPASSAWPLPKLDAARLGCAYAACEAVTERLAAAVN